MLSVFPGVFSFLCLILCSLVIFAALIITLLKVLFALFRRQWRLFAERLIVLTVAYPLMLVGVPLGDYAHLVLFYPYYRVKIAQTSERPVWFPWGDRALSVTDGLQFVTLLYDDTGKSAATIDRREPFEGLCYTKQHLMGNFFLQEAISSQQLRKGCTKTQ